VSVPGVINQDRRQATEPDARRWTALAIIALAQLMIALDATIVDMEVAEAGLAAAR
jgi:hypothetical protein